MASDLVKGTSGEIGFELWEECAGCGPLQRELPPGAFNVMNYLDMLQHRSGLKGHMKDPEVNELDDELCAWSPKDPAP